VVNAIHDANSVRNFQKRQSSDVKKWQVSCPLCAARFAKHSGAQNLFYPVSGGSFLPRAPSLSKPSLKRLGFVVSGLCVVLIGQFDRRAIIPRARLQTVESFVHGV